MDKKVAAERALAVAGTVIEITRNKARPFQLAKELACLKPAAIAQLQCFQHARLIIFPHSNNLLELMGTIENYLHANEQEISCLLVDSQLTQARLESLRFIRPQVIQEVLYPERMIGTSTNASLIDILVDEIHRWLKLHKKDELMIGVCLPANLVLKLFCHVFGVEVPDGPKIKPRAKRRKKTESKLIPVTNIPAESELIRSDSEQLTN